MVSFHLKNRRKLLVVLIALVMFFSLASCVESTGGSSQKDYDTGSSPDHDTGDDAETETEEDKGEDTAGESTGVETDNGGTGVETDNGGTDVETDSGGSDVETDSGGSDVDTDSTDVHDLCPNDPDKTEPGECGCGVPDGSCGGECADEPGFSDAQGYSCLDWVGYDCEEAVESWGYSQDEETDILRSCPESCALCIDDECPLDPEKTRPGFCGCGVPEGTCDTGGVEVNCTINPYARVSWSTFGQYKANYHTHTTQSDGESSPADVIDQYHSAGYSILAITDHNKITWPWTSYGRDPVSLGMIAVKGDEYSSSHHVNAFYEFSVASSNLEKGIPHIQSSGGMCQINHPGRYRSPSEWEWYVPWFRDHSACVGLEVINRDDSYPNDRRLWDNINEEMFASHGQLVWGFANDDKHYEEDLYRGFQFMLLPELTEEDLRQSKKDGAFYFCMEPGGTGEALVPHIENIVVDNNSKTITITATGHTLIKWIGPGTTQVGTGTTFDFSNYVGNEFVRAVLVGNSGNCYTQPFGMTAN